MPFEPPRALSVDTLQHKGETICLVLPWLRDQNKSKTEMLVYFKRCVEWDSSVILQNKVHQQTRHTAFN
jgi:hypothetical protein